jgi:hypothetical protein
MAYIGYALIWREPTPGFRGRNYLLYGLTLVIILAVFAWRITQLRNMIGGWVIPSARDPIHVGATVVAYFGVPVILLGLLAPFLSARLPQRTIVYLLCVSGIPVLELLVIAYLNVVNVTWYYAFISLCGFALLAGVSLIGLWNRGQKAIASVVATGSIAYYLLFLGGYHLAWHGDRPRWDEAARFIRDSGALEDSNRARPLIYSTVPGVVAFYLGADPRRPETYEIVKAMPTAQKRFADGDWYVVEAKVLSDDDQAWLKEHCQLRARFESKTGPVDRSVLVYECTTSSGHADRNGTTN